ncbi:hypothetical protein NIES4102_13680 [Chondrocystis sp. NIES-4102]|nr:hypothetical protein NIES4102_13680 [Chondrocystis sp. NIES-4102]
MEAISPRTSKPINWSTVIMFVLGFWLSGSLILDCLIVPGMLTTGMMNASGFASAAYVIFGTFNHVELLCAATVLAGCLVYRYGYHLTNQINRKSLLAAAALLVISLAYTYIFTPQMSSMGMSLDMFNPTTNISSTMTVMHITYWGLEITKFIAATVLLRTFYRSYCSI